MKCLVTGAAGFIGSHLCERLLHEGCEVIGVDAFIPYYPRRLKEANLQSLQRATRFQFVEADLRTAELSPLLADVEVVFHLAAMAGLNMSWTDGELYESCNIAATRRLLEACRTARSLRKLVYASTSSVYGRYASGDESLPTRPISPYGVTKLAAENLCRAYADEQGLPITCLRYFSVYGPRQRPDMGYHRFIQSFLTHKPITVNGDGQQVRGNTYITDCVEATVLAIDGHIGETYNIGGGEAVSVWDVIGKLERIAGHSVPIQRAPARPGDQRHTTADTSKLTRHLGWKPTTSIDEGLAAQFDWQRSCLISPTIFQLASRSEVA